MTKDELIEELAHFEHERWARWQSYLHNLCEQTVLGGLNIPNELVKRWKRQIETPYSKLTAKEKQSDRDQVAQILPVIDRYTEEIREERDRYREALEGLSRNASQMWLRKWARKILQGEKPPMDEESDEE